MFKRTLYPILTATFIIAVASCQSDKEADDASTATDGTEQTSGDIAAPAPIESDNPFGGDQQQPLQIQPLDDATAATGRSGSSQAGMNPEHGQPGHRCDIPVGAPLDSPPQAQDAGGPQVTPIELSPDGSVPQTAPAQPGGARSIMDANGGAQQQLAPAQAPGGGGATAGVNPPHGEPGHDCSIPVGAPLKN